MQLLLNAAILALPLIIPEVVLICLRIWPMRFPAQRRFMAAAWVLYGLSLLALGLHAAQDAANPVQEFVVAFWGSPSVSSGWCLAGWCLQGLAVLALMFVVNWSTVRLFIDARRNREARAKPEQ